jgi:hypothetical protein
MNKTLLLATALLSSLSLQGCVMRAWGTTPTIGLRATAYAPSATVVAAPAPATVVASVPSGPEVLCSIEAGPLWSNVHAQGECPNVCPRAGATRFTGQWWTTRWNEMSVCQCAFPAGTQCPAVDDRPHEQR